MGMLRIRTALARFRSLRAPAAGGASILDAYVTLPPSPQHALDIFAGEWASKLPPPLDHLTAGSALLFDDARVEWAIERLGGVAGKRVLELGPLEGGHTYMLDRAGAAEVLAIEGNRRAYLKCLVVKELLGLRAARFVCGDFTAYLREPDRRFDVAFASGVLYHMVTPVELLASLAKVSDALFLWTHYYDEALLGRTTRTAHRVTAGTEASHDGFAHRLYRHDYGAALGSQGFCGGSRPYSHWLTRDDILAALRHFGLNHIEIAFEQPDHANGPAFCVVARRTGS